MESVSWVVEITGIMFSTFLIFFEVNLISSEFPVEKYNLLRDLGAGFLSNNILFTSNIKNWMEQRSERPLLFHTSALKLGWNIMLIF